MYGQEQTGTTMPIRAASVFSNFACDEHGGSFLLEMPDDVGSQGERLGLSPIVFIVASESWFGRPVGVRIGPRDCGAAEGLWAGCDGNHLPLPPGLCREVSCFQWNTDRASLQLFDSIGDRRRNLITK